MAGLVPATQETFARSEHGWPPQGRPRRL